MKNINSFFLSGLLACVLFMSSAVCAQSKQLPFPDFGVAQPEQEAIVNWSTIRPNVNHVALVMDAQASNSMALIGQYKSKAFDGQGLSIIVSGTPQNSRSFIVAQRSSLPQANWYIASPQVLSIALKLAGTPHFFGVTQDGLIAWSYAGIPPTNDRAVAMIRDWISKPSIVLQKTQ